MNILDITNLIFTLALLLLFLISTIKFLMKVNGKHVRNVEKWSWATFIIAIVFSVFNIFR